MNDGVTINLQPGDDIVCTFSNRQVSVAADAGGPYAGDEGTPISLDASGSTSKELIERYDWDCTADGSWDLSTGDPKGGTCTYGDNGVYTVRLRTVDIFDRRRTAAAQVTIQNVAPEANAGSDQTVMAGREMSFAGSFTDPGTDDTHTIQWDFGDGNTQSGSLTPVHVYSSTGEYEISLMITDDDGASDTDTLTVAVVNSAPTMSNVTVSPEAIAEGQRFMLTGAISDVDPTSALSLFVDWGDGKLQTTEFMPGSKSFSISHLCEDDPPGLTSSSYYTINLTLTDDEGAFSTSTAVIEVNNLPPIVEAGPDQTVLENVPAAFSATISDPGLLDTHTVSWDFGDGSPPVSGVEASHGFDAPGTYIVTVTVEDDDGGIGQDSIIVEVTEVYTSQIPVIIR
jgi:PKD repeat protein